MLAGMMIGMWTGHFGFWLALGIIFGAMWHGAKKRGEGKKPDA